MIQDIQQQNQNNVSNRLIFLYKITNFYQSSALLASWL
jgi:hypothetical protein